MPDASRLVEAAARFAAPSAPRCQYSRCDKTLEPPPGARRLRPHTRFCSAACRFDAWKEKKAAEEEARAAARQRS